ncbi:MAG: hypothetical protein V4501_08240 [Pseudomonadota bacterium]
MHEYNALPQSKFLKDVEAHQINIIKDDGLYRHVRFSRNESSYLRFDLITWPGYLCITGDCETFIFARLPDMFEFFEGNSSEKYPINPGYWSEKLQGKKDYECFSEEKFNKLITDYFNSFCKDKSISKKEKNQLWAEIKEQVLDLDSDGAQRAAYNFSFKTSDGNFNFQDFYEHDITDYTHHFLWACYAIIYGIKKYREHKNNNEKEVLAKKYGFNPASGIVTANIGGDARMTLAQVEEMKNAGML